MASLKALRSRIKSVKSTQKITKAMKMVAASKLRRAREAAENARPYAEKIEQVVRSLAAGARGNENAPRLLMGSGGDHTHLLVVMTSDRGLCGAFNGSIIRAAKRKVAEFEGQGKQVKMLMVGRKGYDALKADYKDRMVGHLTEVGKKGLSFTDAERVALEILSRFDAGEFDIATILYNRFRSAIAQIVTFQQLIPLPVELAAEETSAPVAPYEYEPEEDAILADLLPRNLRVQVFRGLLENAASEQGARMTAMDNATRNAGEMIKKLTLVYNRTRQAAITKELIEIISGAEAL